MKKFDAKITEIEEGLRFKDVFNKDTFKQIGRVAKNTVVNPVKNVAKTGSKIVRGGGNVLRGAVTGDKDRLQRGVDQSLGTVARGLGGTVGGAIDNTIGAVKDAKSGNLIGALSKGSSVANLANPVAASKAFTANAAKTSTPGPTLSHHRPGRPKRGRS